MSSVNSSSPVSLAPLKERPPAAIVAVKDRLMHQPDRKFWRRSAASLTFEAARTRGWERKRAWRNEIAESGDHCGGAKPAGPAAPDAGRSRRHEQIGAADRDRGSGQRGR